MQNYTIFISGYLKTSIITTKMTPSNVMQHCVRQSLLLHEGTISSFKSRPSWLQNNRSWTYFRPMTYPGESMNKTWDPSQPTTRSSLPNHEAMAAIIAFCNMNSCQPIATRTSWKTLLSDADSSSGLAACVNLGYMSDVIIIIIIITTEKPLTPVFKFQLLMLICNCRNYSKPRVTRPFSFAFNFPSIFSQSICQQIHSWPLCCIYKTSLTCKFKHQQAMTSNQEK